MSSTIPLHDHTHMLGLTETIIPGYEAICPASQPLSSQHVLGGDGVHEEKRPPGAPTLSLLHELDRNLNLLEMDHEQTTAHVHGINDSEFGARKDEHLRLRLLVLKDRVSHNVDTYHAARASAGDLDAAGQGDRSEVGRALCGVAGAYVAEHAQSTPEGRSSTIEAKETYYRGTRDLLHTLHQNVEDRAHPAGTTKIGGLQRRKLLRCRAEGPPEDFRAF